MSNKVVTALAVAALVVLLASPVAAQSMEAKRDAKMAEAWTKKANWIFDYDKAREEAKKSGKHIFAYFTRSYAY